MLNFYMVKDLKNLDLHANMFATRYQPNKDVQLAKADLVLDSCLLTDFHVIGAPDLLSTAQL